MAITYELETPRGVKYDVEFDQDPTPEMLDTALQDIVRSESDTGQSKASSAGYAAVRGAASLVPSAIQGVGALIPGGVGDIIRGEGQSLQADLEDVAPVNPAYEDTKTVKAAGAVGQGAAFLGAALAAPPSAVLGVAGLAGAAGGADLADELDLTGWRRGLTTGGYAGAEILSERLFGIGSPKFLKGAGNPIVEGLKAVAGEAIEEPIAGVLQDVARDVAVIGTDKPMANPLNPAKRFEEAAYGAIGALAFGGAAGYQASRLQGTRLMARVEGELIELDPNITEEQVAAMGLRPDQVMQVRPDPAMEKALAAAPTDGARKTIQEVMLATAATQPVFETSANDLAELDAAQPEDFPETTDPAVVEQAPGGISDLAPSGEGTATGSSAPSVSVSNSEGVPSTVNPESAPTSVADLATSTVTADRNVDPAVFRAQRIAEFQQKDPDAEPSSHSFASGTPPPDGLTPAAVRTRVASFHRMSPQHVEVVNRPEMGALGWINKRSGTVVLNAPYLRSQQQIDETLYHEYVHRIEYDPDFQKDLKAAMGTFSRADLDRLDDAIAKAKYDINEIPTERQATALARAAVAFRKQPGYRQIIQRIKTWFKQQFGRTLNQRDAEAIAARILAKSMAQARAERGVITQAGTGNVRRSALPADTEVTLTATTRKGPVELSMDAREAEAMLEKRRSSLQALLDCLDG